MPERSIVRELITLLGFDVDEKTAKRYDKLVKTVKDRMRSATIAAGVYGGAIAFVTRQIAKEGTELIQTSRELDLSTTQLQEWRFAAKSAGVETTTLTSSLRSFNRRIGLAATRGAGPAVTAIAQLGLQLRDTNGEVREMDTLLTETFEALEGFTDTQKRAALAADLFNLSGSELNKMLVNGAEGIALMRKRAHELGGVMSEDLARQSEKTTQAWTDFMFAIKGVRNMLAQQLLPSMRQTIESWGKFVSQNRDLVAVLGKVLLGVLALRIPMALLGAKMAIILAGIAAMLLLAQDVALAISDPGAKTILGSIVKGVPTVFSGIIQKIKDWITEIAVEYLPAELITGLKAVKTWAFGLIDSVVLYLSEQIKRITPTWLHPLLAQQPGVTETQRQLALNAQRFGGGEAPAPPETTVNFTINQTPGETTLGLVQGIVQTMGLKWVAPHVLKKLSP
jgi:hypothetical protein